MKVAKTFTLSEENIKWLQSRNVNMSETLDNLVTQLRSEETPTNMDRWKELEEKAIKDEEQRQIAERKAYEDEVRRNRILAETPEEREARRRLD